MLHSSLWLGPVRSWQVVDSNEGLINSYFDDLVEGIALWAIAWIWKITILVETPASVDHLSSPSSDVGASLPVDAPLHRWSHEWDAAFLDGKVDNWKIKL